MSDLYGLFNRDRETGAITIMQGDPMPRDLAEAQLEPLHRGNPGYVFAIFRMVPEPSPSDA